MDLCKSSVTKPLVHFSNGNEEVEEGNRQKSIRQLILLRCRLIISCLCRVARAGASWSLGFSAAR